MDVPPEEAMQLLAGYRAEVAHELAEETVTVPSRGRFVVYDGVIYRITDMWREQGPTSDGREKWGVVLKKEKP
jgi:hypothetical protein